MLLAAEDRYQDAEELLAQRRYDGCVYLLGFSAEMWLKAVCMRLRGLTPADLVMPALPALRKLMKQIAPAVLFTDYHDLSFYVRSIEALRLDMLRPLAPDLQRELNAKMISVLYAEWIVDMRYRRSGRTEPQAWQSLESAWWIKSNWIQFL
ncbi:MAG: hypothetical protein ABSB33_00020 [Tepidisphaeraceae bacterium]